MDKKRQEDDEKLRRMGGGTSNNPTIAGADAVDGDEEHRASAWKRSQWTVGGQRAARTQAASACRACQRGRVAWHRGSVTG